MMKTALLGKPWGRRQSYCSQTAPWGKKSDNIGKLIPPICSANALWANTESTLTLRT